MPQLAMPAYDGQPRPAVSDGLPPSSLPHTHAAPLRFFVFALVAPIPCTLSARLESRYSLPAMADVPDAIEEGPATGLAGFARRGPPA